MEGKVSLEDIRKNTRLGCEIGLLITPSCGCKSSSQRPPPEKSRLDKSE